MLARKSTRMPGAALMLAAVLLALLALHARASTVELKLLCTIHFAGAPPPPPLVVEVEYDASELAEAKAAAPSKAAKNELEQYSHTECKCLLAASERIAAGMHVVRIDMSSPASPCTLGSKTTGRTSCMDLIGGFAHAHGDIHIHIDWSSHQVTNCDGRGTTYEGKHARLLDGWTGLTNVHWKDTKGGRSGTGADTDGDELGEPTAKDAADAARRQLSSSSTSRSITKALVKKQQKAASPSSSPTASSAGRGAQPNTLAPSAGQR